MRASVSAAAARVIGGARRRPARRSSAAIRVAAGLDRARASPRSSSRKRRRARRPRPGACGPARGSRTGASRPPRAAAGSKASASAARGERVLALRRLDHRPVERRQRLGRAAACSPAIRSSRRAAWRSWARPPSEPCEQRGDRRQLVAEPRARLHVGAQAGERRPPRPARGRAGPARRPHARAIRGRARRFRDRVARLGERRPRPRARRARPRSAAARVDPAEGVEQGAVAARVEQAAIVMLAVNLDEQRAELAQQAGRDRLVVDEGAAAAVGLDDAADDERLARLAVQPVLGEQRAAPDGPAGSSKATLTTACAWPGADQAAVGARAERQAERVEQDRFARPGLAGQHAEARPEFEVERSRSARRRGSRGRSAWESSPGHRLLYVNPRSRDSRRS